MHEARSLYFLRSERLREDLVQGTLPSFDVAVYLALVLSFHVPIWYPALEFESIAAMSVQGAIRAGTTIASTAVSLFGVRACYIANGGAMGNNLAERYISLGWVVAFQISLVALPFYLAAQYSFSRVTVLYYPPVSVLLHALFYWRLVVQLRKLRMQEEHAA